MNSSLRLFLISAGFLIALGTGCAQQRDWTRIESVPPGESLAVTEKDSKTIRGTLRSWSAEALALEVRGAEVRVARDRVREVQDLGKSHRVRNAIICGAIGVAIGVTMNATLGTRLRNEGQAESAQAWFILGPALAGAGLGALVPGYPTIYNAPRH